MIKKAVNFSAGKTKKFDLQLANHFRRLSKRSPYLSKGDGGHFVTTFNLTPGGQSCMKEA